MHPTVIRIIVTALALCARPALAWDAGPDTCKHSECSGGAVTQKLFVETDCKKFGAAGAQLSSCPAGQDFYGGICYRGCPRGTHRTAVCSCKRDGSKALDLSSIHTSCGKYGAAGTPRHECPAGQDLYGGVCYRGCPSGGKRTAVCSCSSTPKWEGNTHLFVVDRALELLARSGDGTAARIASAMNAKTCRAQWEQGLWDVDDGELKERPNAALGSHFYDGAALDWFDKPTQVVTYQLAQSTVKNKSGDARSNAGKRLAKIKSLETADSCYQLGLMLHYVTDMTQPMHVTGLSIYDYVIGLHPIWEAYVPLIQARYPAQGWDKRFLDLSADQAAHQIAVRAQKLSRPLLEAIDAYRLPSCTYTYKTGIIYTGRCFRGDAKVDATTGAILREAYQSTASYLHVSLKSLAR